MSRWRTCSDVRALTKANEDGAVSVSAALTGPDVSMTFHMSGDDWEHSSIATFVVIGDEVEPVVLREILVCSPNQDNESFFNGMIMSIGKLDSWIPIVVTCLVENEKCGGHWQKEYGDKFGMEIDGNCH